MDVVWKLAAVASLVLAGSTRSCWRNPLPPIPRS